jgi:hypothetical protein
VPPQMALPCNDLGIGPIASKLEQLQIEEKGMRSVVTLMHSPLDTDLTVTPTVRAVKRDDRRHPWER